MDEVVLLTAILLMSILGPGVAKNDHTGVRPGIYKVDVKFAGFDRTNVRAMLQKVEENGWKGGLPIEDGGERTTAARGKNEVRYGDGDGDAAEALAKAVEATNVVRRVLVVKD